jgi:hypothetical protein
MSLSLTSVLAQFGCAICTCLELEMEAPLYAMRRANPEAVTLLLNVPVSSSLR